MPKKLKLDLKALKVQSFVTELGDNAREVKGGISENTICIDTCFGTCPIDSCNSCVGTCPTCNTCGQSCGGTCATCGTCETCGTCGETCNYDSICLCTVPPMIIC